MSPPGRKRPAGSWPLPSPIILAGKKIPVADHSAIQGIVYWICRGASPGILRKNSVFHCGPGPVWVTTKKLSALSSPVSSREVIRSVLKQQSSPDSLLSKNPGVMRYGYPAFNWDIFSDLLFSDPFQSQYKGILQGHIFQVIKTAGSPAVTGFHIRLQ